MRLAATIARSIKADLEAEFRAVSRAVTAGVKDAGDGLKDRLRKQVTSAGFGGRLARTWRGRAYPNKGYDAASLVWSKAPQIVRAFDTGTVLRGRDGLWLAIPTENAPKKGVGGKRINPSNFPEHRFGPLRFVYRRNGPSLLVVDDVRASYRRDTGELRGFRKASAAARRSGRGSTTVVMFILVRQVRIPKRLDVKRAAEFWTRRLPDLIERHMRES